METDAYENPETQKAARGQPFALSWWAVLGSNQ